MIFVLALVPVWGVKVPRAGRVVAFSTDGRIAIEYRGIVSHVAPADVLMNLTPPSEERTNETSL